MSNTMTLFMAGTGPIRTRKQDARLREVLVTVPELGTRRPQVVRFLVNPTTSIRQFPDRSLASDQLEPMNGETITFMAQVYEIGQSGVTELICDKLTIYLHD